MEILHRMKLNLGTPIPAPEPEPEPEPEPDWPGGNARSLFPGRSVVFRAPIAAPIAPPTV